MSRSRGGSNRGRGAPSFLKKEARTAGQEDSRQHDPTLLANTKPRDFYPEVYIPNPPPSSRLERAQYKRLRDFRRRIHDGPFYTVIDEHARVGKPSAKKASSFNPFEDMPTYTQKYKPPFRTLPRFDTQRYSLKLFPKELWDVLKHKHSKTEEQAQGIPRGSARGVRPLETQEGPKTELEDDDSKAKPVGEEEETIRDAEEDSVVSESNPEDDFEDNDSDMAGDYNAEGYFSGGEDDGEGMDGDGGDEGGFD